MLLFVVTVWGTNFVVMKVILEVMHPHVVNVFRIISAGLALLYLHHRRQRDMGQTFFQPLREYPVELVTIGVLGWFMYQIAFIVGLDNTTAGTAAIIMASLPLWTALISVMLRVERLTHVGWLGIVVTMVGTGMVILSGDATVSVGGEYLFGNLIMLSAALLWGLNTVLTRRLVHRVSPVGITILALLVSLPLLSAVSIPYWSEVMWDRVDWVIWAAIIFSGSLSTGLAIVLWNAAVKKVGASHTAAFQNLVPIIALITSYLILHEQILPWQIIGGSFTILGLVIMRKGRNPAEN